MDPESLLCWSDVNVDNGIIQSPIWINICAFCSLNGGTHGKDLTCLFSEVEPEVLP